MTIQLIMIQMILAIITFPQASHSHNQHHLTPDIKEYIAQTLQVSNPAKHLKCTFQLRELHQHKSFISGIKNVETLEITFNNTSMLNLRSMKAYFPLGSKVTIQEKNNSSAGLVEEITMEANDLLGHVFTFQHDGNQRIINMSMHNDLTMNPCQIDARSRQ